MFSNALHATGDNILYVSAVVVATAILAETLRRKVISPVIHWFRWFKAVITEQQRVNATVKEQLFTNNGGSTLKDKIEGTQQDVKSLHSDVKSLHVRLDQLEGLSNDEVAEGHIRPRSHR